MGRLIATHQLTRFKFNPNFPVNTLKIMRLAVAAQALGCGLIAIEAFFSAMWEQGRNMDNPDEIAGVLSDAALDVPALVAKAQDPRSRLAWQPIRRRPSIAAPSAPHRSPEHLFKRLGRHVDACSCGASSCTPARPKQLQMRWPILVFICGMTEPREGRQAGVAAAKRGRRLSSPRLPDCSISPPSRP
jgi:hypothetical protein